MPIWPSPTRAHTHMDGPRRAIHPRYVATTRIYIFMFIYLIVLVFCSWKGRLVILCCSHPTNQSLFIMMIPVPLASQVARPCVKILIFALSALFARVTVAASYCMTCIQVLNSTVPFLYGSWLQLLCQPCLVPLNISCFKRTLHTSGH